MTTLGKHWTSAKTKDYIAGINLYESTIQFNPKNPTKFTIRSSAGKDDLHEWAHVKGARGSISTREVVKNFDDYFQSAYPSSDDNSLKPAKHPVIASMPSGFGDGSFLFKHRSIRHKNNELVWKGKILDHNYVLNNHSALSTAFGDTTIHNHLRYDPKKLINPGSDESKDPRQNRILHTKDAKDFAQDRDPLYSLLGDIGRGLSGAAHSIGSAVNNIGSEAVSVGEAAGNSIASTASDTTSAVKNAAGDVISAVDSGLIVPLINGANAIKNDVAGKKSKSFSMTWPGLDIGKTSGPFTASLSATPSMTGELVFTHGYVGASNPETIQLSFKPSLPIKGYVEVDLSESLDGASLSIDGPSVSTEAPVIEEATLSSSVDFEFKPQEPIKAGLGKLNANVTFNPAAEFSLSEAGASFKNATTNPIVTNNLESLFSDDLAPGTGMTFTVTPSISLSAGPRVPNGIPYVGGMSIATLSATFSNPIVISQSPVYGGFYGEISVSGNLSSNFEFFGDELNPPLANETLYGPINSSFSV